jgi:phenylacetate-CoA ligase
MLKTNGKNYLMTNMLYKIYKMSPIYLQNLLISGYGFIWYKKRFGGVFGKQIKEFKKREKYNIKQWDDYQTKQLRKLLVYAYKNVPFYKEKYSEYGFTLNDFESFEIKDLKKLPYLEKEDLRKYGTTTLLSNKKEKGSFIASSGSTGTPTKIYFSKKFHQTWSAAYESRVRNWAGVNYKMARGMIGGRRIIPNAEAKAPFYRYNYFEKQTYFSAYHLSENTVKNYVEGLLKNKVEYLVGYAMSIYFWADFINKQNIKTPKLKAVLTSSEKLTKQMRKTIEEAFQCKVYDGYSGVEACGLISENQYGELLFSPDTGIMEILNNEGKDVAFGEVGEVVATGFLNYDQPLIRYRIGDRVKLSKNQMTKSGLEIPIIEEIEGRLEDVIIGEDGRKMVRFHSLFIDLKRLKLAQVIQHKIDKIEIKLITDSNFDIDIEKIITKRIKSQLGEINIYFTYVKNLPRTKNGKIKAVISKIKNE